MVEKGDLLGLDYLWEVCLHIPDESIADSAIQLLLNMSYNNLNPRLKKVIIGMCVVFVVVVFCFVFFVCSVLTNETVILHMECVGSNYLICLQHLVNFLYMTSVVM